MNALTGGVREWRRVVEERYSSERPASEALFNRARQALPGGDTRYSATLEPFSTYFVGGRGQELWDADGNRYVDLINNNTSLVHGHAHPVILDAVQRQLVNGTAWTGPNPAQVDLAELLVERVPSFERVRFTNSGSEATAMMIKVARAFTGRDLIMKMDAAYHGSGDLFEFGPSADDPTRAAPLMAGLPTNLADNVIIGSFNDTDLCLELIERYRDRLAAVISDAGAEHCTNGADVRLPRSAAGSDDAARRPALFRRGHHPPPVARRRPGAIRRDAGSDGGRQDHRGRLSVGAFGGRADVMAITDPAGSMKVAHAGTFNGNPVTMAAGRESVAMLTTEAFSHLERMGRELERGLHAAVAESRAPMDVARSGSLLWLDVAPGADSAWTEIAPQIRRTLRVAYLEKGVHAMGINATTVMTDADVHRGVDAIQDVLEELMSFVGEAVA